MSRGDGTAFVGRSRWVLVLAGTGAAALLLGAGAMVGGHLMSAHEHHMTADAAMTGRAQQVMPFDLSRTVHTFIKTATGGVEKVVVIDASDTRDLTLIRQHLAKEAALFRSGNYADPAAIHGMNMPGLAALEAGAARVSVSYTDLAGGAQITYASTEPGLVSALHAWFDRQVSDHSMPGMGG